MSAAQDGGMWVERLSASRRWQTLLFSAYWVTYLAAILATTIWPEILHDAIRSSWLWNYIPPAIAQSAQSNLDILRHVAPDRYALGFFSLRILGAIITSVWSLCLVTYVLAWNREYVKGPLHGLPVARRWSALAIGLLLGATLLWWAMFSPDFYFVSDGDYSGILRPGFGEFALFGASFLSTFLIISAVAILVRALRESRRSAQPTGKSVAKGDQGQ